MNHAESAHTSYTAAARMFDGIARRRCRRVLAKVTRELDQLLKERSKGKCPRCSGKIVVSQSSSCVVIDEDHSKECPAFLNFKKEKMDDG